MDKLNRELLERVEKALNLKFEEWQINYILDIPMLLDMRIASRGTGKTLAYTIKLLFKDETPIKAYNINNIDDISDDDHTINKSKMPCRDNLYNQWFRKFMLDIYECLIKAGIEPRIIFMSEHEKIIYERKMK